MKIRNLILILICFTLGACDKKIVISPGERLVLPSDPAIGYSGRWDKTSPDHPSASWPGFSLNMDFKGRLLKIVMRDDGNDYNVDIDGKFQRVIGGKRGLQTYVLLENPGEGTYHVSLQRRNISLKSPTVIEGFLVNQTAKLTHAEERKRRKIEFIGDSFTAAEGNEAVAKTLSWDEKKPVTNFALGYASLIGRALDADVTAVCRSGAGLICDWQGQRDHPMGERYGWTLMEDPDPPWAFTENSPDVVVISLGLNDFTGLKGKDGNVSQADTAEFCTTYRNLISQIRVRNSQARIVALASFVPWQRKAIATVLAGPEMTNVIYAEFDYFPGGYVADGHPTVDTHRKMADQILRQLAIAGIRPVRNDN